MKGYDKTSPQLYGTIIKQLIKTDSIRRDDSYIRIHYIRYADDFVIGVIGSHTIAKAILERVEDFVNKTLKLKFNPDKTSIIDFSKHSFNFLGYNVRTPISKKGKKPLETIIVKGKAITRRKKVRTIIEMDTNKVLKRLKNSGFIRMRTYHRKHKEKIFRGKFKGNLINLDHPDILKYYNSVVRGIQNYYEFSKNRVAVARIG